jgi:hypothetical protein
VIADQDLAASLFKVCTDEISLSSALHAMH